MTARSYLKQIGGYVALGVMTIAMALAMAVIFASQALAADNVTATKHNLSANAVAYGITNFGQICVYCHTPHNGSTTAKPLWNRGVPAGPFTMYDNAWSSTINETVDASPGGVSAACLSCHDATIGLDTLTNRPGSSGWAVPTNALIANGASNDYQPRLGTDMRNDHPVSITYRTVDIAGFKAAPASAKLYSNKVECGSCHNPHEDTLATFLRASNAASALCLDCHNK